MSCDYKCDGDNCGCEDGSSKPVRINVDGVMLKDLHNIVYTDIEEGTTSKFEVLHFEIYFICSQCNYTHKFEKDEAPFYAIKFMLNYPCLDCGNIGGFSEFMVRVSPDEGATDDDMFIRADSYEDALNKIEFIRSNIQEQSGRA